MGIGMLAAIWAYACLAWTCRDGVTILRNRVGDHIFAAGAVYSVPLAAHWRARVLFRKLPYPPEILELLK